jgi:hypothetical protein
MIVLTGDQRSELEWRITNRFDDEGLLELAEILGIPTDPDDLESSIELPCHDCEVDTNEAGEYYMLNNDLWARLAPLPDGRGYLCIGCAERRLGRRITPLDFSDAPINQPDKSERLLDRLGYRNVR